MRINDLEKIALSIFSESKDSQMSDLMARIAAKEKANMEMAKKQNPDLIPIEDIVADIQNKRVNNLQSELQANQARALSVPDNRRNFKSNMSKDSQRRQSEEAAGYFQEFTSTFKNPKNWRSISIPTMIDWMTKNPFFWVCQKDRDSGAIVEPLMSTNIIKHTSDAISFGAARTNLHVAGTNSRRAVKRPGSGPKKIYFSSIYRKPEIFFDDVENELIIKIYYKEPNFNRTRFEAILTANEPSTKVDVAFYGNSRHSLNFDWDEAEENIGLEEDEVIPVDDNGEEWDEYSYFDTPFDIYDDVDDSELPICKQMGINNCKNNTEVIFSDIADDGMGFRDTFGYGDPDLESPEYNRYHKYRY